MTVSLVGVDEPAGSPDKNLHTNARTISSVAREDQYVQLGQPAYPTFVARASGISIATTADHILQIMADGTNYTRLVAYRITLTDDRPAADNVAQVALHRITTAGTGGSSAGVTAYDTAETYSGGAMTLPTAKGTEGAVVHYRYLMIPTAFPSGHNGVLAEWEVPAYGKPIIFGTGTGAGLAWKIVSGVASCTINIEAEFVVTTYL
jgi:hypothetical protein